MKRNKEKERKKKRMKERGHCKMIEIEKVECEAVERKIKIIKRRKFKKRVFSFDIDA